MFANKMSSYMGENSEYRIEHGRLPLPFTQPMVIIRTGGSTQKHHVFSMEIYNARVTTCGGEVHELESCSRIVRRVGVPVVTPSHPKTITDKPMSHHSTA